MSSEGANVTPGGTFACTCDRFVTIQSRGRGKKDVGVKAFLGLSLALSFSFSLCRAVENKTSLNRYSVLGTEVVNRKVEEGILEADLCCVPFVIDSGLVISQILLTATVAHSVRASLFESSVTLLRVFR